MDKIKACQFADLAYYSRAKLLPDTYQQVAYLQSDGGQYFDIGPVSNHQYYEVDFIYVNFVGTYPYNFMLGSNGLGNDVKILFFSNGQLAGAVGDTSVGTTSSGLTTGVRHTVYFAPNAFTVDGVSYFTTEAAFHTSKHAYVFYANGYPHGPALKMYKLKTSSIELYPCYRKTDSKPGMFDVISKTFYTNSGTGDFTVGGNV